MFSILSWNILQGGGSRLNGIVQAIADQNATVLCLSEFRNNESGQLLRSKLLALGYRYQAVTWAPKDENSVLIASKMPCNSSIFPNIDPVYAANVIAIEFEVFQVMSVYFPHKKKHDLLSTVPKFMASCDKPFIIAGDFNTGINGLDQEGNSFWYEQELKDFQKYDYYDVFRQLNGPIKEYSWFSHQGNGFRYDHIYAHKNLLPIMKTCSILHSWREAKLSDHAPLFVQLG